MYISRYQSNSIINYGNIDIGGLGLSDDSFSLSFNESIFKGTIIPLEVRFSSLDCYSRSEYLNLTIGEVNRTDPLGPDLYGYYIYDSSDTNYELAPIYDWIEIDPEYGGDGIDLNLTDSGNGNNASNSTATVDLPFVFYFYGSS